MKMRGSGDKDYSLFVQLGSLSGILDYCNLPDEVQQLSRLSAPMIDRFIETHQVTGETPERTKLINTSHASYIMGIADGASNARREFYKNADISSEDRKKACERAQEALTNLNGEV